MYRIPSLKLLLRSPSYYWTLGMNRVVKPAHWKMSLNQGASNLGDTQFMSLCGAPSVLREFVRQFHEDVRLRFFFHPRNQKDFFLNLLTKTQDEESILAEAQNVLENKFDTLGSGIVQLGELINWQRDFKSGKVWELKPAGELDIMDLLHGSDVKVPWELSRFHQVWWLGKAYWLTRDERYAQKFKQLVEDWIEHNPPSLGVNWTVAMEASIRASNWIAGYYFFCESRSISEEFWFKFIRNLYVHGVFIESHLEYSWCNGNHLLSDIVGLVVLGVFFRGTPFGQKWLKWGTRNLEREMEVQVSSDGVDYEKSTSYQRLVVELFYTATILCRKNGITLAPKFLKRLENMIEFVQHYLRPDGSLPLFGDADDGRLFRFIMNDNINDHRHVLSVGAILFNRADFKNGAGAFLQDALWLFGGEGFEKYQQLRAEEKLPGSRAFPEGGFYIMRGNDVHVMVDAGEIGMGGMGGHGHNDTLSFEYWGKGNSLIVDSGTYAYTFDVAARQELRSTKSHNTIVVDGKEIAEFVGLWMIENDATKPRLIEWTTTDNKDILEVAHHAYQNLPSPVVQRRRFELDKTTGRLYITDFLEGRGEHLVESYLHFAPLVKIEKLTSTQFVATNRNGSYIITTDAGEFTESETWYSPTYGIRMKNKTVKLQMTKALPLGIHLCIEVRNP